jgi:drug/metabolite transporter (DMT)-like permease
VPQPTESPAHPPRRILEAGEGASFDAFEPRDWGFVLAIAATWGSSFLFIAIGLDAFAPGVVSLARVALGVLTLSLFPRARQQIEDRGDLLRIAVLGQLWIGVPFLLFPIAQQHVDSSVAGMINASMPIAAATWGIVLLRRLPGRIQLVGLAVGFTGIVLVFLPQLRESQSTAFGAALLLLAIVLYGLSTHLVVPLQQRYGGLAVIWRAQLSALVLITPVGLWQLPDSTWSWGSALALVPLGVVGTGLALVWMADLAGRVGGSRASIATYLIPLVAIVLGVVVRDETVAPLALGGMVLVLLGAFLASRAELRR